jgi:hypothetical protein
VAYLKLFLGGLQCGRQARCLGGRDLQFLHALWQPGRSILRGPELRLQMLCARFRIRACGRIAVSLACGWCWSDRKVAGSSGVSQGAAQQGCQTEKLGRVAITALAGDGGQLVDCCQSGCQFCVGFAPAHNIG